MPGPRSQPVIAITVVAGIVVVLVGAYLLSSGGALGPNAGSAGASGAVAAGGSPSPGSSGGSVSPIPSSNAYFPGDLLIADRGNGRLLIVDQAGTILWKFPESRSQLPKGQQFSADDAFIDPTGRTIVANDEFHETINRIDIATHRIVWQYGRFGVPGAGPGELHTPDDAYPLANGDITVADIENCRILEIAPDKSVVRQWGKTGVCRDEAGVTFARPNGDTPLPDGGLLVTEITGSRVVRLRADGSLVYDIHVPVVYPSDAQLDAQGNVIVSDFSTHGQVVDVNPTTGQLVWRYAPKSGPGALNHPSLAAPLPDGNISINDDFRDRMLVVDPIAGKILWQYGRTDVQGTGPGLLTTPDGHQALPPGLFPPAAASSSPAAPASPATSP